MKNGFTLVELLAVIIIILTITLIVTFSVSSLVSNSKKKVDEVQLKLFIDAAGMWLVDNMDKFTSDNMCLYLTFYDLYEYGYIDEDAYNWRLDNEELEDTQIRIDLTDDKKYDITITSNLSNCDSAI